MLPPLCSQGRHLGSDPGVSYLNHYGMGLLPPQGLTPAPYKSRKLEYKRVVPFLSGCTTLCLFSSLTNSSPCLKTQYTCDLPRTSFLLYFQSPLFLPLTPNAASPLSVDSPLHADTPARQEGLGVCPTGKELNKEYEGVEL